MYNGRRKMTDDNMDFMTEMDIVKCVKMFIPRLKCVGVGQHFNQTSAKPKTSEANLLTPAASEGCL